MESYENLVPDFDTKFHLIYISFVSNGFRFYGKVFPIFSESGNGPNTTLYIISHGRRIFNSSYEIIGALEVFPGAGKCRKTVKEIQEKFTYFAKKKLTLKKYSVILNMQSYRGGCAQMTVRTRISR